MTAARDYVTIVSGLPRSGTSMMMRMLAAGGIPPLTDNLRVADEDNPRGYYEFEPVKKTKEDASWLATAGGKVVKMVYRLLYDLPAGHEYRVVFMRRKLEEVLASQNVMLDRQGKATGDLPPEKLHGLFNAELEKADQWIRQQPHFKLLYADYNETLSNPAPTVEALNNFLDGNLDTAAMLKTVEPQLYRQRK
ncbi:MAG: sulfotransferase family protein [Phycisphaerae bacterium]|jgi:hypothetical protein